MKNTSNHAPADVQLHPLAVPISGAMGREVDEPDDPLRSVFQRDRDRIIHATAFRRLQGKTQVFVSGEGDHFRTRLTHTMEVAQISRDIARALGMNEDLAECIALAHDLGHPPFGHAGEEALHTWMMEHNAHFEHNEQSYRIITLLEKRSRLYSGLNLNREVVQGLLKHSVTLPGSTKPIHHSIEAQIANISDEIAYTSHDSDDGLIGKLFSLADITAIPLAQEAWERAQARGTYLRGSLVHLLVQDLLAETARRLHAGHVQAVALSEPMRTKLDALKHFLQSHLYPHPRIRKKAVEGMAIVDALCRHYMARPPNKILQLQQRTQSTLPEAVKDYVAGMTDSFAWLQAADHGLLPSEHA